MDTSGWYAVASADDRRHGIASAHYLSLVAEGARLLTSDYILDETITRLRYDFGHHVAVAFREQVERAAEQGFLNVVWVDERVWRAALALFRKYDDQEFSFTDCTSFVLTQELRPDEAFAFDSHFTLFGAPVAPGS